MIRPDAELLLDINDLHASVEDQPILKGVNLQVRAGTLYRNDPGLMPYANVQNVSYLKS